MPHIHTEPGQHDQTASAFIVRTDTPEPTILFHMHKKVHKLLQPGGHVELHETPWQAVLHEIEEETGYKLSQLTVLQPQQRIKSLTGAVNHPVPLNQNTHLFKQGMDHFHTDTAYAFMAGGEPMGTPGDLESSDLRWLTAEQLRTMDQAEIGQNSREIALYTLAEIFGNWESIDLDEFQA